MNIRVKFKVSIVAILTTMVVLVGASISGLFWVTSSEIAEKIAKDQFENQTNSAEESFTSLLVTAGTNAAVGAAQPDVEDSPEQFLDADILPIAIETLRQNPSFYSLYYGFEDGTFFQVIATRGLTSTLATHKAPAETTWIVRAIVDTGERLQKWAFSTSRAAYWADGRNNRRTIVRRNGPGISPPWAIWKSRFRNRICSIHCRSLVLRPHEALRDKTGSTVSISLWTA
ncbi:MAG: hypothetical protein RIM72_16425 [Alphaproteobacteria bacterium]